MKWNYIWLAAGLLSACSSPESTQDQSEENEPTAAQESSATLEPTMLAPMQEAHGASALAEKEAIKGEITLYRGGEVGLAATMYVSADGAKVRMEMEDGTLLVFDGQECWTNDSSAATPRNRFHLLTWSYFLMAPYKVADPGTNFEVMGQQKMMGQQMAMAGKLTFDAGVGDSPEDWYILYTDPKSHLLQAMSYIVTFSGTAEEAEPHAIRYEAYTPVAGVQIPANWSLYGWSEAEGITESLNTTITFTDARFVASEQLFQAPKQAYRLPLPGEA